MAQGPHQMQLHREEGAWLRSGACWACACCLIRRARGHSWLGRSILTRTVQHKHDQDISWDTLGLKREIGHLLHRCTP